MTTVFHLELDTTDFFDSVAYCNDEDTNEWEGFVGATARAAASIDGPYDDTELMKFMERRGYTNQIADILYEAIKSFTNRRILDSNESFDLC